MERKKRVINVEKNKENHKSFRKSNDNNREAGSIKGLKKIYFTMLLVLSPFIILGIIEVILRISGYGYPTDFLIKKNISGQEYYIENQKFGYRFFPKAMARTPEPLLCPVVKPPNTFRIVVFGESAALGDPAPEFGFSRMLEVILRTARKDLDYEVINVSMTAINSYVIEEIAKDCRKLSADVWIIYAGNNEVIGPFSPGTVFGPGVLPRPLIKFLIQIKSLRVYQFMESVIEKISPARISQEEWGGMEMFLKKQIRYNDPVLNRVYSNFERSLINIVDLGKRSSAAVILSKVIANYRDCAPFSSSHKPISESDEQKWNELFKQGVQHEADKNYSKALEFYKNAQKIDETYAELNYRLAKCLENVERNNSMFTNGYYQKGIDYDTLRFRPDSKIISAIESVGKRFGGDIIYIDTVKELYANDKFKLPGRDILWEHVHLNFDGNYRVALLFAREILKIADAKYGKRSDSELNLISKEYVFSVLGLTDWDKLEVGKEMRKRLQLPPFTHRCDHNEDMAYLESVIAQWEQSVKTNGIEKFIQIHKNSVESNPKDWILRKKYAEILEYVGEYEMALEQWNAITNLLPQWVEGYYRIGNLLDQIGRSAEAVEYFKIALQYNPNSVEAMGGLGLCFLNLRRYQESIDILKKAISIKPNFAPAYVNLSLAYANMGKMEDAKQQCYLALKARTNYAPAYINLGKFYASEGRFELALTNYIKASIAEPNNPIVLYNIGNGYARLDRHNEAIASYLKAIELKPDFGEAILNLAVELSAIGKTDEAFKRFGEAVRLMPENPEAIFNYGIACARYGDYKNALNYLEKATVLMPQNPQLFYNLGLVCMKVGLKEKAIDAFSKVLNIEPNNEAAQKQLSKLKNSQ